jgi:RHS repeat-associated protein
MANLALAGSGWSRARRTLLVLSTILCSGLAAPAWSQSADPLVRSNLDANAVDLATGTLRISSTDVSIGAGNSGLNGTMYWRSMAPWQAGFNISLSNSSGNVRVNLPDRTATFMQASSTSFYSQQLDGSTLTASASKYFFTEPDGAVITFDITGEVVFRPSKIQFPNGNVITLTYNTGSFRGQPMSRLASAINSNGYQLNYEYITNIDGLDDNLVTWFTVSRISSVNTKTLSPGSSANYIYTFQNSGLTAIAAVDPMGSITNYRLNNGSIGGITRPGSASEDVIITYDSPADYLTMPRVTSVTNAGGTTAYGYTDNGTTRTTTVTDPLGHVTNFVFDMSLSRPITITDATGRTTTQQYDAAGRLTRTTAPEGNYTQYTYDDRNNITETRNVAKPGAGIADVVTSASYDTSIGYYHACTYAAKCNRPNWTRDAKGNQTDYTYDNTTGNVTSVTAPASASGVRALTSYSYTIVNGVQMPSGSSICSTAASCVGSANEIKSSIAYNTNGLPTTVAVQAGDGSVVSTATKAYDDVGNKISVDGPLPGSDDTTFYRYNADREMVGVVAPDPDGGGVLKRKALRNTYDPKGRVTLAEIGTVTDASNDAWGDFSSQQQVSTTYDGIDRPTQRTLTAGGVTYGSTLYNYDHQRLDNVTVQMNGAGPDRATKYAYDNADRQTKVTNAYGTSDQSDETTITYTSNGNQATSTDAKGNVTTTAYEGLDRVSTVTFVGGSYEKYTYDANGNVTQRRLRDGQLIGFTHDALNRVITKTPPSPEGSTSYSYDLLGRTTGVTRAADGMTHSFAYDALGRVVSEGEPFITPMTSQYDLAGRRTRLTWNDNFYVTYDYLVTGEVAAIRENGAPSGIGVLATYGYDNLGNRTSLTRGNGAVTTYALDAVSRLSSLTHDLSGTASDVTTTFTYNPASQIAASTRSNDTYAWTGHYNVNRPYVSNGLNQFTTAGSIALGYDGRGNLTTSGTNSYGYTAENLMKSAPGIALSYDALGRLAQYDTSASTRFAYDGSHMTSELANPSGAILRRYVYGPGADEPLVWYEGADTANRRWLIPDERGSVVAVTDASGTAMTVNTYDEYGIPGSNNLGRFQYTGQAWLPELGMSYYKARIYSPTLGRFMQTDPIGYGGGPNWYNYVRSDPINGRDPSGLCGFSDDDPCPAPDIIVSAIRTVISIPQSTAIFVNITPLAINYFAATSQKPQNGHWYRRNNKVCGRALSAQQRAGLLSIGAIPGHGERVTQNGTYLAAPYGLPGGYVNTRFSADHNQVVNITTSFHAFSGSITRTIYSNAGGTFVETIGVGNAGDSIIGNIRDILNQDFGPGIFDDIDSSLADYSHQNIPGC